MPELKHKQCSCCKLLGMQHFTSVLGFFFLKSSGFVLSTLLLLKGRYNHSKSKIHKNDPTDNNPTNCCLRNNKQVRKVGFYKSLP